MKKILILAASNGHNLETAKKFESFFKAQNADCQVLDLTLVNLPLYTPQAEEAGFSPEETKEAMELTKKFSEADSLVFVAPEYNGGIPPVLTNTIAWISRSGGSDWRAAFNNKPALISSFSGSGGFHMLMALRTQLSYIGMNVKGRQLRGTAKAGVKQDDLEAVAKLLLN